jgi:hypothetical protein
MCIASYGIIMSSCYCKESRGALNPLFGLRLELWGISIFRDLPLRESWSRFKERLGYECDHELAALGITGKLE